ncbi:MAG: hypothetical protein IJM12_03185 [Bacteroidales bacterium]|nr:hypothetical protein [Bacteroidales bacterium]MBR0122833.1 hypothetical protein [Bacteroidales bacterium]MBR5720260.1 hypothetical protein [Bacteroidales bacterium]
MKRRFFCGIMLFVGLCGVLHGQDGLFDDASEANIVYSKESSVIVNINSSGLGAYFRQGNNKDAFRTSFFEIGFSTYRDPKQETFPAMYRGYSSYVMGKINWVLLLRGDFGMVYNISRKPYWGGVDVNLVYAAGLSLALAKPVYVYVIDIKDGEYVELLERYDPDVHTDVNILGRGPFFKGIWKTIPYPGINGKLGFNFEYGEYTNVVKSLELGAVLDYFPIGVPIMAYNDPKNLFFSFYLSVIFGKRYNQ